MPKRPSPLFLLAAAALLASVGFPHAAAQDARDQPQTQAENQTQPQMHPGVLLGRRAGLALAQRGVIPVVVLVPDPASYAHAIAGWSPDAIYPVLIDDGSTQAREDIARFVRSFQPESVVRWEADEDATQAGAGMRRRVAVPNARELADAALADAWDFTPTTDADPAPDQPAGDAPPMIAYWIGLRHAPPGIVIADERDPGWTAALALAAARGQPIEWVELPERIIDQALTPPEIGQLCEQIEQACNQTRLPWRDLGDAIDAITICAALPARYETAPKEFNATSDRLGRFGDESRWAWAGQIFGSEPQAAYRAMCSVFLGIRAAWLFDGYGSGEPWDTWDCTEAAAPLREADILTMLDDQPRNKVTDWKLRCERPIHAELICLNSSGNRAWFDLAGTRAWSGDLPLLEVPAAVHMVHSWSAAAPGQRITIAGRWFERGVFAYAGSVHEPYLQAFVPTPVFTRRMIVGMAFGAAARVDSGGPWRVAVLGDPLFAYAPRPERLETALPLEGAVDLTDELKAAASRERYADMYAMLGLLGRDSDTARLFEAMLRDRPQDLDVSVASAALFALFRAGADESFLRAYAVLPHELAAEDNAVDALWHVGRRAAREGGRYREAALGLMAQHPRDRQEAADAAELKQLGG